MHLFPKRLALALLFGIAAAALAGCSPALRDGWYACTATSECPAGFTCQNERCSRGAGTECRVDLHCDDFDLCTLDICEGGLCSHDPDIGACDDGDFCNGADECRAGVCTNVGPAPCPGSCDELGCSDCGRLFGPCCEGYCIEGTCNAGTCEPCGAFGGPCCFGPSECNDPGTVCDGLFCVGCGGAGSPCCLGGSCDGGLSCDGVQCSADPTCVGISCPSGSVCMAAACVACGGVGDPCCDGSCMTGSCDIGSGRCVTPTCGGEHQECCVTFPDCGPDLVCFGRDDAGMVGTCVGCGRAEGDPCCPPSAESTPCADVGLACDPFTLQCASCGVTNNPCCAGSSAAEQCPGAGNACVAGICRSFCGEAGEPCCALRRCAASLSCNSVSDNCG